jgi:Spy/CpxP family protein refolding chaperone
MTRQRWMVLGLLLSIAFNCAFLGAFGYRLQQRRKHRSEWNRRMERVEPNPTRPGGPGGGPGSENELNLGPAQREQLKRLRETFFPQMHQSHERIFEKRKELAGMIASARVDTTAIGHTLDEIGRMQIEIEQKVVRQMLKERELMDPKQRGQFNQIIIGRFGAKDQNNFLRRFHKEESDNRPKP